MIGEPAEMVASQRSRGRRDGRLRDAYLGAAMDGETTLFARQDYVEEAWRIRRSGAAANTPAVLFTNRILGVRMKWRKSTPLGGWHDPVVSPDTWVAGSQAA